MSVNFTDTELGGRRWMRMLKVMADYQCFPLWEASGESVRNVDPTALPLSSELMDRLNAWATNVDTTLNLDDPATSGFSTDVAERTFHDQGRHLSYLLNEGLGDGYAVIYDEG